MYLYAPDVAVPGSVGGSAFSFADVNSLFQKKKKQPLEQSKKKKLHLTPFIPLLPLQWNQIKQLLSS